MIMLLALLLQQGYTINGKAHAEAAELASIPQSGRVTIDARDRTVSEVAEDISRQAGFRVRWDGAADATVTLAAERAPFVAVVAELARTMKCAFEEFQSADGPFVQIPGTFVKSPVLAWHAQGPLVVTWHGLATWEKASFDGGKPKAVTRYALRLWMDPRGHVRTLTPARDQAVTFAIDGAAHVLKSDHDPNVFSSSAPTWEFEPRAELAGDATIEVAVPFHAPSRTAKAELAWEKGKSVTTGEVTLTVESVASGRKKVRDPKDVFKQIEVVEATAVVKLRHVDAALYDEIAKSRRQPTEEEGARLLKLQEGGVALALHEATVGATTAMVRTAAGASSPFHGYRFEVTARSTDQSFAADRIAIVWAEAYEKREARFRIDGAKLK